MALVKFCLRDAAGSAERARWLHLARSGSQSQHVILFILPTHGASHIITLNNNNHNNNNNNNNNNTNNNNKLIIIIIMIMTIIKHLLKGYNTFFSTHALADLGLGRGMYSYRTYLG